MSSVLNNISTSASPIVEAFKNPIVTNVITKTSAFLLVIQCVEYVTDSNKIFPIMFLPFSLWIVGDTLNRTKP